MLIIIICYLSLLLSQFIILLWYMTKRSASYNINPNTYEAEEKEEEGSDLIDPAGAHMKGRR